MLARRAWTPGIINEALPGAWLCSPKLPFLIKTLALLASPGSFFDLDCKFPESPNRDLMRMKLRIALIIIVPTPKSSCFSSAPRSNYWTLTEILGGAALFESATTKHSLVACRQCWRRCGVTGAKKRRRESTHFAKSPDTREAFSHSGQAIAKNDPVLPEHFQGRCALLLGKRRKAGNSEQCLFCR